MCVHDMYNVCVCVSDFVQCMCVVHEWVDY